MMYATLKNKIRGLIGTIKGHRSSEEEFDLLAFYQAKLREILLEARHEVANDDYDSVHKWVRDQLALQIPAAIVEAPNNVKQLMSIQSAKPLSFKSELMWATSRLSQEFLLINNFRQMADALEFAFLSGDFEEADAILEDIFIRYGFSLWHIEASIGIAQISHGLETQKQFSDKIKKLAAKSILSFLSHHISVRNEPNTTIRGFLDATYPIILRLNLKKDIKIFLRHRLIEPYEVDMKMAGSVLRIAQGQSVIDLYESYIELVQAMILRNPSDELRTVLVSSLSCLSGIDDWRIAKALLLLGQAEELGRLSPADVHAHRAFRMGMVKESYRRSLRKLKAAPNDIHSLFLAAASVATRSDAPAGKGSFHTNRVHHLSVVLSKGEDFIHVASAAQKTCRNLSIFPSMKGLAYLFREKNSVKRILPSEAAMKAIALNTPFLSAEDIAFGISAGVEPKVISDYDPEGYREHTDTFSRFTDGTTMDLVGSVTSALLNTRDGKFSVSGEIIDNLRKSGVPAGQTFALLVGIECALQEGKFSLAIEMVVHIILERPELHDALDLSSLFGGLTWDDFRTCNDILALAVFLDFYAKESGDSEITTMCRFAFDDFLEFHNISKPSEIIDSFDHLNHNAIVYFLRFVCVKTVMDMNTNFSSSRDIEDERMNVCAILSRIDPEDAVEYQSEVFLISHGQMIQEGIKLVDSSRIHVDKEAISQWAARELREPYARYLDLLQAGIGVSENFEEVIRAISRRSASEKAELMVPDNEADDLLVRMVGAVRDKFLFDSSHGLDSYLSKRVRHGSVLHHMRGPVEREHLITQRSSSDNNRYIENLHWSDRLKTLNDEQKSNLHRVLAEFSKRFDNVILDLIDNVLHIRGIDYPRGLLEVEPSSTAYDLLKAALKNDNSVSALVDGVFAVLWGLLEVSLGKVRNYLRVTVKREIADTFERLRSSLIKIAENDPDFALLSNCIGNASAATQAQIEVIAGWFVQPKARDGQHLYTLDQAVAICIAAATRTLGEFHSDIKRVVTEEVSVLGADLIKIYEVIWVMLQNVRDHSGVIQPRIEITGSYMPESQVICIRCENDVAEGRIKFPETEEHLADIRRSIDDGTYKKLVRGEVKSGFAKITDLVVQSERGRIDFGYSQESRFFVEVVLSIILDNSGSEDILEVENAPSVG